MVITMLFLFLLHYYNLSDFDEPGKILETAFWPGSLARAKQLEAG
jgi:hypothetical protein